jgi:hypothetical protein
MLANHRDEGGGRARQTGKVEAVVTGDGGVLMCHPNRFHIPSHYVVEEAITQRKPPEVRIWTLRNQSRVGTVPPSTSTPH